MKSIKLRRDLGKIRIRNLSFSLMIFLLRIKRSPREIADLLNWQKRHFSSPAPNIVKWKMLSGQGISEALWIETGTFQGQTSRFLASQKNTNVITFEPSNYYYNAASKLLKGFSNVRIINSTSEASFESELMKLNQDVNFFLDGHNSGGHTYHGEFISPILFELLAISKYIQSRDVHIRVFIDDFRLFLDSKESGYPEAQVLIDWSIENELYWKVENDIFIALR